MIKRTLYLIQRMLFKGLSATGLLIPLNSSLAASEPFHFVALGDTAYTPGSYEPFQQLIQRINRSKPAFSIHVGDTQGHQPCDGHSLDRVKGFFDQFDHPVFYTPGDNEWTDCKPLQPQSLALNAYPTDMWRLNALSALRQRFFAQPQSLGQRTMAMTQQSHQDKAFKEFSENAYWFFGDTLFATLHVVGSENGMKTAYPSLTQEALRRQSANLAWLKTIQSLVHHKKPKALVIALHAELFAEGNPQKTTADVAKLRVRGGRKGPYYPVVAAIDGLAKTFDGPTLLVHGDFHQYKVDQPFNANNITRLEVFGEPFMNGVKVTVDTTKTPAFAIAPLQPEVSSEPVRKEKQKGATER